MTKRLSVYIVALLVILSLLMVACNKTDEVVGDTDSNGDAPAVDENSIERFAPIEGKEYELAWAPYITDPISPEGRVVQHYQDKFNVKFDMWNLDHQNIHEVLNLKFAAGEIPDYMADGVTINNLPLLVDQGVLLGFDEEVIKEYMPNVYEKATELEPNWLNYAKVGDKIYGLPEMRDVYKYRTTIVWRGDWLENVGITKTPETLEEFEEALYKIAHEDPDGNGKKDTYGLSLSGIPAIFGAFGYVTGYGAHDWQDWFWQERDGKLVNGSVQPEIKEALALLNKWYKDGVLDPEFITGENMGGYWADSHAFINGKIGFTGHGQYYHWTGPLTDHPEDKGGSNYAELLKVNPEAAKSLVHGPPPVGPNGEQALYAPNMIAGKIIAFGAPLEQEPDKFGKILQILDETSGTTKENYVEALWGIEGEMWTEKGPGQRVPTPEYEDVKDSGASKFAIDFALWDVSELGNEWAAEHDYDVGAVRNQLVTALPSESKYRAELTKIRNEAYISIITGDKPVDYFDEFVEKWNSLGGEQVTDEANEWYSTIN
ncbi:extracellular solute-binding protein [Bacillus solitudinis]|uniref:extracellular solute-binding protein n=1 Tax=Bacillus solitudinis TaxID=2014074 RepID=UPI000C236407|nr:extracellular solute-binding protein [Bacillus solitudinis]